MDDMKAFLREVKEMRIDTEDIRTISKNPFFKKFTHEYSQHVNDTLKEAFGPHFNEKSPALGSLPYNEAILGHVSVKNDFRSHLPHLFTSVNTSKHDELQEKLKFLEPALIPPEVVRMNKALFTINSPMKTSQAAENLAELTFVERM